MKVDITSVLKNSDERIDFDYPADFSELELADGERPAPQPLAVRGSVFSRHGAVTLEFCITGVLTLRCDRCASEYELPVSCPFSAMVSADSEQEESEKLVVAQGNVLDIGELAQMALLLWMPTKQLCREDCRGLCPICGENLNEGECGCDRRRVDPRLEGLKKFLE